MYRLDYWKGGLARFQALGIFETAQKARETAEARLPANWDTTGWMDRYWGLDSPLVQRVAYNTLEVYNLSDYTPEFYRVVELTDLEYLASLAKKNSKREKPSRKLVQGRGPFASLAVGGPWKLLKHEEELRKWPKKTTTQLLGFFKTELAAKLVAAGDSSIYYTDDLWREDNFVSVGLYGKNNLFWYSVENAPMEYLATLAQKDR